MKKTKILVLCLCTGIVFSGCGNMSNTAKGGIIGGGGGAALGAIVGGLVGHGKGAAIGAAVGAAVGTGAGVLIGKKMDKAAAEAAQINGAQVQQITDSNGLQAVKVTFDSGILFGFNSAALSTQAQNSLTKFAAIMKQNPTMDIAIMGHTDKVGTQEANLKVSTNRADAVQNFLIQQGVSSAQIKETKGLGFSQYDDALTAAQNRRVEVYMYASKDMIKQAEAGNL